VSTHKLGKLVAVKLDSVVESLQLESIEERSATRIGEL
jgi:hypothetical protein